MTNPMTALTPPSEWPTPEIAAQSMFHEVKYRNGALHAMRYVPGNADWPWDLGGTAIHNDQIAKEWSYVGSLTPATQIAQLTQERDDARAWLRRIADDTTPPSHDFYSTGYSSGAPPRLGYDAWVALSEARAVLAEDGMEDGQ